MFPGEWMCGPHWRMVPARGRRALRKVWRELKASGAYDRSAPRRFITNELCDRWARLYRLDERLWHHAKRAAILRVAGL